MTVIDVSEVVDGVETSAVALAAPLSREHLWGLLVEAAEIEHNLMCCYLYAAFSLKESVDEDLSSQELDAVRGWRGMIMGIAIEEMGHLALVSNILSSLGAPAHFARQNFPVPPGYHPAGVVVKLAPFNPETLDHFIYLERPETVDASDGAGFEPAAAYSRVSSAPRLTAAATDYATVGQLYSTIGAGLRRLATELGEDQLFVGDEAHQLGPDVLAMEGLTTVRCLRTAEAALAFIVHQGEGSDPAEETSHYWRFLAVRDDYREKLALRPGFQPARPAAHSPVMRKPLSSDGRVWVQNEAAASLLDLGNAIYTHSLRCLSLAYAGVEKPVQRILIEAGVALMRELTTVGSRLTTLEAGNEKPQVTAGLSFATSRSAAALTPTPGSLAALIERTQEIGLRAQALAVGDASLRTVALAMTQLAQRLQHVRMKVRGEAPDGQSGLGGGDTFVAPPTEEVPAATGAKAEVVQGEHLELIFDAERCIHARHCVLTQPQVFQANVKGPWLNPDAATVEAMVTVAHLCPSGAVQYRRKDGGPEEGVPLVNLVQLRENGPLGVRGAIVLDGRSVGFRATLCRCGASQNKPYCDGSHKTVGFLASAEPDTRASEALDVRDGPLAIDPETNGPLVVTGNLEVCSGTGRTIDRTESVRLCRCGGSANKPFCDGSHRTIGFRS